MTQVWRRVLGATLALSFGGCIKRVVPPPSTAATPAATTTTAEWPCSTLGFQHCSEPAGQFTEFAAGNKAAGIESMAVIPMVDYVTADKSGPVSEADKAPSKR